MGHCGMMLHLNLRKLHTELSQEKAVWLLKFQYDISSVICHCRLGLKKIGGLNKKIKIGCLVIKLS